MSQPLSGQSLGSGVQAILSPSILVVPLAMLRVFRRTNPQGIVLVRGETTPTFFLVAFDARVAPKLHASGLVLPLHFFAGFDGCMTTRNTRCTPGGNVAFHVVVLESRHDFCLAKMEDLLDVDIRTQLPNGRFFLDCHHGAAHGRDSLAWLEAEALTIKP